MATETPHARTPDTVIDGTRRPFSLGLRAAASVAGLLLVGLVGWVAWNQGALVGLRWVEFDSPLTLAAFGFLAGIGAFFAPCTFALFPAYISYYLTDHSRYQPRESRPLDGARSHVCRRKRRVLRGGRRCHHPRGGRHLPVSDRVETGGRHRRCITRARARRRHSTAVDRPPTRASRRPVTSAGRGILLWVLVRAGV